MVYQYQRPRGYEEDQYDDIFDSLLADQAETTWKLRDENKLTAKLKEYGVSICGQYSHLERRSRKSGGISQPARHQIPPRAPRLYCNEKGAQFPLEPWLQIDSLLNCVNHFASRLNYPETHYCDQGRDLAGRASDCHAAR